jgi:hypothetical protein
VPGHQVRANRRLHHSDGLCALTRLRSLAYCELYLSFAALVLRVFPHMKLYKTTIDDVAYDYDLFVPMAKSGSQGVRVTME